MTSSPGTRFCRIRVALLPLLLCTFTALGCDGGGGEPAVDAEALAAMPIPAALERGATLFDAQCSLCHGAFALGTQQGPPLLKAIYRPSHHGDEAFQLAVARGVRAHHWRFGDMPPVPGLVRDDVTIIVAYVRWLQRAAGIN